MQVGLIAELMEQKAVMQEPIVLQRDLRVPTFLKWAGGKQQLLSQFNTWFPEKTERYVEPFLGGGAVLFYVLQRKNPKSVRAYDINGDLINTYVQVKNNVEKLIKHLKQYAEEHNASQNQKAYYLKKRIEFNHLGTNKIRIKKNDIKKAALFIYLNKTCYNGLFRVNSKGEFNVPFNGNKNVILFNKGELREASQLIQNVTFAKKDFREINFDDYDQNTTIYFDPPYWSEPQNKGFTGYANPDFDEAAQKLLATIFLKLSERGCHSILSNSDTSLIRKLYNSSMLTKISITARRLINCNGSGRGKIRELLIIANC